MEQRDGPFLCPLTGKIPCPQYPTVHDTAWARLDTEPYSAGPIKSNALGDPGGHLGLPYFINKETEARERIRIHDP